jgi:hypothetical protein
MVITSVVMAFRILGWVFLVPGGCLLVATIIAGIVRA